MKKILIEEMSWTEFREVMGMTDLVIFPVGSVEEHGKHNPLGTDYLIAKQIAYEIGKKVNAPVAPVMPIGNADNMMSFPGTISIGPELFYQVIKEVCEGFIKHGAKRFLFVNGHGGNTAILKLLSQDLNDEYGVFCLQTEWWITLKQISEFKCDDHGGKYETSLNMVINGEKVNLDMAEDTINKKITDKLYYDNGLKFKGVNLPFSFPIEKITDCGNIGSSPKEASIELGEEILEAYLNYCYDLAAEIKKVPLF